MSTFDDLILKLDAFIRRYYKNQLIKGGVYFGFLSISFFVLFALVEFFGNFGVLGRSFLFFSYLFLGAGLLVYYIVIPVLKIFRLGPILSHQKAASIIGKHFPEIQDKITNTLQLKTQTHTLKQGSIDLLNASIDKRVTSFSSISFNSVINFKENLKHLKPLIFVIAVFLLLSFIDNSIIFSSADRIIHFSEKTTLQLTYNIQIENPNLAVLEQDDFTLLVHLYGKDLPKQLYLNYDNKKYTLRKRGLRDFEYEFKNVAKNIPFAIVTENNIAVDYLLKVLPKPKIDGFSVLINYPKHTKIISDTFNNLGNLNIIEGSVIKWIIKTKNVDSLSLIFSDSSYCFINNPVSSIVKSFSVSQQYYFCASNKYSDFKDSTSFFIAVEKDLFPKIKVSETIDSTSLFMRYFKGDAFDDFGFSSLLFCYKTDNSKIIHKKPLKVNTSSSVFNFYHYLNLKELSLKPGEKVEYYFEIYDNDGVNGPKKTTSKKYNYSSPTLKEAGESLKSKNNAFKNELEKNIKDALSLKNELKEIKSSILNKNKLNWEDENKIENYLNNQKQLEQQLQELLNKNPNSSESINQEIAKKQEQINQLFDELMSDEMKKLYDELQKLMQDLNKEKILENIEQLELSQEDLLKEMDRSLEQFKQFEMDQKLESLKKQLEDLSKKQLDISEKSKQKKPNLFELNKKQEEVKKDFNYLSEQMEELEKLNEELEFKKDLPSFEEEKDKINDDINESQKNLEQKKNKKASDSQKQAGEKMEDLANKLGSLQMKMKAKSQEMDMKALRQLLENLITFSFDQEEVITTLKKISAKDPKYVKTGQQQQKLEEDVKIIEDSLLALSKRVPQLGPHINSEVSKIKSHLSKTIKNITERKTPQANANQQYVMTSVNNLALLLDDVLKQLQQSLPGTGQCNKPGGNSKSSSSDMGKMMEKMKQQLEEMKKMMEGENGEGKKKGEKLGKSSSEGLAKLAAQQAALRKQIQELSQKQNEDGSKTGNGLKKIIKELEKNEEDLINNSLDLETIKRQQEIISKLLEHEKATREQEKEKKRESKEIKEQDFSNPNQFLEYKRKKEKEVELLKSIPPSLRPYYKTKVNEYFRTLQD
ncbi:MAG: hypothetical protein CL853_02675 [Crocinitomicaceae bacterium]|nr:hypothetical protein [Crocinitomicaceae bacterium]